MVTPGIDTYFPAGRQHISAIFHENQNIQDHWIGKRVTVQQKLLMKLLMFRMISVSRPRFSCQQMFFLLLVKMSGDFISFCSSHYWVQLFSSNSIFRVTIEMIDFVSDLTNDNSFARTTIEAFLDYGDNVLSSVSRVVCKEDCLRGVFIGNLDINNALTIDGNAQVF